MVESSFPSLLSSSPLPIKSIEPSKLTTRRSLFFTLGFSFIVFAAFTFFLSFCSSSSTSFFDSSLWFNSFFIRSTINSNTSSKSHYFNTFFSHRLPYGNNDSYNDSSFLSHPPNATPPSHQVSNESSSSMHDDGVVTLSQKSNNSNINNQTTGLTMDFDSKSDFMKRENEVRKYLVPKEKPKKNDHEAVSSKKKDRKNKLKKWVETMKHCNIFDGGWVRDNSYPLFKPGSCPFIDEPFNCFVNGRKDNGYEKYRWQPNHCNIPRMNGRYMLEMLRGKRLVFIGDSLNRNMWESMVCILRNAAKDKTKVFEASGREEFRTTGSYSFVFRDYNCSVEFYRSTFLVQEWVLETNGSKKETLRIDTVESAADMYKSADVLVFNTGHWWTHEKTSSGKGYYQEGEHVHDELHVDIAFRKAMTTWGNWVEANVDPVKTLVVFRSYSVSHFRGGEWNSGGRCDGETEPLREENEFEQDPSMVKILESVLEKMKAPVFYLNVTRMTNFRKDAHPSIYREQDLSEEMKKSPLKFQDCSHWCLPGVPDTWNEIIYSQLLLKHRQAKLQRQQQRKP